MSNLEHEVAAYSLHQEAEIIKQTVMDYYGVNEFDDLPQEGFEDFDSLMALAGWTTNLVINGETNDEEANN